MNSTMTTRFTLLLDEGLCKGNIHKLVEKNMSASEAGIDLIGLVTNKLF